MAAKEPSAARSKRRRLGRGLSSLISSPVEVELPGKEASAPSAAPAIGTAPGPASSAATTRPPTPTTDDSDVSDVAAEGIRLLATSSIRPGSHQPRQTFDEIGLESLAASIRTAGLMQPVVVRPDAAGGFQLIAGERRWRAAQLAGLQAVPALVRDVDARTAAELSLVENLQREDLNPIERAEAFQRLIDEFGLTHQQIADHVGLNRASITNHLRLLELELDIREVIRHGQLSLGHAKALLSIANIDTRRTLAGKAVRQGWSVRETEKRARVANEPAGATPPAAAPSKRALTPHLEDLQTKLGEHLGTKVSIQPSQKKGAGRLVIEFYDLDQFEGIMERLGFALE
ncbi:MAG: ParB/RepB/Spo0J family partition protein [Planctomycetota bacterium]|jgi:ParB family chromosome partitioning protein